MILAEDYCFLNFRVREDDVKVTKCTMLNYNVMMAKFTNPSALQKSHPKCHKAYDILHYNSSTLQYMTQVHYVHVSVCMHKPSILCTNNSQSKSRL